jgi:ATP phosphoribosyltransferase
MYIKIALAKGRLAEEALNLLSKADVFSLPNSLKTRKLVLTDNERKTQVILVKAGDVPTYVENGAAHIGFVGKDILMENKRDIYEMLDLKFGKCKFSVAGTEENIGLKSYVGLKVATKYPKVAEEFFRAKGQQVEIIKLDGSVELAPLMGLSNLIIDLVETGRTLKENGLFVLEDIAQISARLIANRVGLKMENGRLSRIIERIKNQVEIDYA